MLHIHTSDLITNKLQFNFQINRFSPETSLKVDPTFFRRHETGDFRQKPASLKEPPVDSDSADKGNAPETTALSLVPPQKDKNNYKPHVLKTRTQPLQGNLLINISNRSLTKDNQAMSHNTTWRTLIEGRNSLFNITNLTIQLLVHLYTTLRVA